MKYWTYGGQTYVNGGQIDHISESFRICRGGVTHVATAYWCGRERTIVTACTQLRERSRSPNTPMSATYDITCVACLALGDPE